MKNNILEYILTIIGLLILAVILFGYPTLLLWNWLMPTIFNLPEITFWQALGINALSTILFKSNITTKKD